ncbi:hypothetical protein F5Y16DRAFT_386806 [Xylariaceae sp. FL0255]|nr:hypothetical protein F5Y16DRAFT_386806 [Xylariaceae sp. FL0255]
MGLLGVTLIVLLIVARQRYLRANMISHMITSPFWNRSIFDSSFATQQWIILGLAKYVSHPRVQCLVFQYPSLVIREHGLTQLVNPRYQDLIAGCKMLRYRTVKHVLI